MANYFSLPSFVLYVAVGCMCGLWMKLTYSKRLKADPAAMYFGLWFFLTLFAVLRAVGPNGLGGMDAYGYDLIFRNLEADRIDRMEPLFKYGTMLIRYVTSEVFVYRFVCYGAIAFGYLFFLKRFVVSELSFIPFILMVFPYLRSFNTMRNSVAIAVFVIGIVLFSEKKTLRGVAMMVASFFFHRMSIIYIAFIPFYYMFRKSNFQNGRKLFVFLICYLVLGYLAARLLQDYIIAANLLSSEDNSDMYYISTSVNENIFSRIPLMFQHILLLGAMICWNSRLPRTADVNFLRLLIVFDILIVPVSVVLGMWRSVEYFYIPRLVMWGYLIPCMVRPFTAKSKRILGFGLFAVFVFWLCFRIAKEWEPAGLLPYVPIFLN